MSRILIVDDNASICESLAMALRFEGHVVECASNETDMFSKINEFRPALVFLDMLISGEDGCTICSSLREDAATKMLPIIIMSAHPDGEVRAKSCGANAFLPKPFELNDLFALVKQHVQLD